MYNAEKSKYFYCINIFYNKVTDYKYISSALKAYFREIGMTQLEIASRLNVSQQSVGAYLNGQPFGKKVAERWSKLFGIQYSWLLTGEGEMFKGDTTSKAIIEDKTTLNITDMDIRNLMIAIERHGETLRMNQEELAKHGERLDRMLDIIAPIKQSRVG